MTIFGTTPLQGLCRLRLSFAARSGTGRRVTAVNESARLATFLAALTLGATAALGAAELHDGPLFDAHIHYNSDVWESIAPAEAIERMRSAGIRYAFVSSTPTDGTERVFAQAPAHIIPLLRPYRSPADRRRWFADPELVSRLRRHLAAFPYRGIGEFHVFGADASTPEMQAMIELAVERSLFLHAHADADAIARLVERAPDLTVIWAHAGFDVPVDGLAEYLARYPKLLIELSYRGDVAPLGVLADDWRNLFVSWPDRFLVGMDTHVGGRWAELGELATAARRWLAQLPADVAQRIAFKNAADLVGIRNASTPSR